MNIVLFDDNSRVNLLPLTFTKPVDNIRVGILTIREKWERCFNDTTSSLTKDYLQNAFPLKKGGENLLINGSVCPNADLVEAINELKEGDALVSDSIIIACKLNKANRDNFDHNHLTDYNTSSFKSEFPLLL